MYTYIYIKWTMFVEATTKSTQHAHVQMIAITKWLPPWSKGHIACLRIKSIFDCLTIVVAITSMKPWSYKGLEFGLFQQYIYIWLTTVFNNFRWYICDQYAHSWIETGQDSFWNIVILISGWYYSLRIGTTLMLQACRVSCADKGNVINQYWHS